MIDEHGGSFGAHHWLSTPRLGTACVQLDAVDPETGAVYTIDLTPGEAHELGGLLLRASLQAGHRA